MIKIGDLVQHISETDHGIGIITQVNIKSWGQIQEPPCVKVLWTHPSWHDPEDGCSVMYQDEIVVISESC